MQGLELSRLFYRECGRKMIFEKFPEYSDKIAVAFCGQGSDKYGFDDEASHDHDFACGFMMFVDNQTEREIGFELAREYRKLPGEFCGVPTREKMRTRAGLGVITYDSFFVPLVGESYQSPEKIDYLHIPQNYLADALNGEVFFDGSGKLTDIRRGLKNGMSDDVRLKKISANLAGMAQSGQYNYARCLSHGEEGAAVMALCEFVKHTCAVAYLVNREFMPYYKWRLCGLARLRALGELADSLEFLLTADNEPNMRAVKSEIIEDICKRVAERLVLDGICERGGDFLEEHALSVLKGIKSSEIRSLHILDGAD